MNQYADTISSLSLLLLNVHRSLLDFQRTVQEELEERQLSALDVLNMAINHPDFEWLRGVSAIIAQMNEAALDKKNPPSEESVKIFARQLREVFIDSSRHINFKNRLKVAFARDPTLHQEMAELRRALEKLR